MNIAVGRENLALAYLANALRSDPEKQEYRVRLADLFMRSYWWLPTRPFAESEKPATVLLSSLHDDNSYLTILRSNGSLEEWGTSESTPSTSKILNGFATGKWDFARFNEKVELLFTASESKRFQVWSCVSGQPVSSIESVPWSIRDATFSADSSRILLIGSDAVGIWDVSMRKLIWSAISAGVAGLQGAGTRPAGIHPDGQRFFFRESGTTVEIRSLQDGASVGAPVELPGGAGAVSFTADGKNLSVIVAGKSIRVQNLANRERVIDYSPDGGVREIVHGPGTADTWLAVLPGDSSKHKVILKNLGSGDEVQLLSAGSPTSIRFSRDGSLVAVASDDRVVQVWKVRTGERITRELVHDDLVSAIQFNDTKPTLSTTTNRGAVQIWDLDSSQRVGVPFGGDHRLELARFQESAVTALTIGADNSVTAWKVGLHDDSEILRELQLKPPSPVAFSGATLTGDGAWILTASAKEGRVVLWDARTASPKVKPIDVGRSPTRIIKNAAVSRSGERVAVNYQNGSVSLWDVSSQKELRELLKSGDRQLTTGFSPDGQTVLVAFTDGKLRIAKWRDADTKPSILSLKGTSKAIEISEDPRISAKVSFSEDRRRLSVAANNVVQIWDVDSGEPVGPDIESNYEPPTLPAVSPDRRTVVAGVDSKQLRVSTWRRSTTSPWTHGDLPRFTSPISAVSWNGTSTRFATLTESGEVRVWARDTLQPVGPQMILRGGTPVSIAFSFDSKRLLTVAKVSKESRLQLWDIQAGILIGRPLVYPGAVKRVEASSDGRFFMIFGDDGYVRLVSNFVDSGSPVEAGLLANFAEAVSGYRIEKNLLQRIPDQWAELKRIRQSVAAMPDEPGSLAWYILRFFKRYEVQPLRTAATTR